MESTIKILKLDDIVAVESVEEIEQIMYSRDLVAAIEFNHLSVSL